MTISKELLDELLSGVERPEDLLGDKGLMKELKVRLMERMLGAELTEHLGYEPHGEPASQQSNRRNGAARKVLKGNDGAVPIDIPRDRDGSFEPELIQKGQTRIDGMTGRIPRNTHLMILKPNDKYPFGGEHGEVIPFFAFPPAVRKIIYTTNAIESLPGSGRGSFPTDAAATKLNWPSDRKGGSLRLLPPETSRYSYPERFNK